MSADALQTAAIAAAHATAAKKPRPPKVELGWCELVDIDAMNLVGIRAKIDTGARTSALHATEIATIVRDGEDWVRFLSETGPEAEHIWCEAPLVEQRCVTSSNGVDEMRYIIDARIKLAGISLPVQLSLTDRTPMAFPMLIGRTALKRHFLVNVARKYVHGSPDT